jgi:hypothetical protein
MNDLRALARSDPAVLRIYHAIKSVLTRRWDAPHTYPHDSQYPLRYRAPLQEAAHVLGGIPGTALNQERTAATGRISSKSRAPTLLFFVMLWLAACRTWRRHPQFTRPLRPAANDLKKTCASARRYASRPFSTQKRQRPFPATKTALRFGSLRSGH